VRSGISRGIFTIAFSDRSLGLALVDMTPENAEFTLGETHTFIFATQ
jgi:hypothetical protein